MVLGLKVCSSTEFAEAMNSEKMIPGIKLFGRKIFAAERHFPADSHTTTTEFPTNSQTSNVNCGDSQVENPVKSSAARTSQSPEKGNLDPNEEEKTFKKPDKILPCPRCNSLETKFCYFNNYNVNQPRHFCKNCQRYWTAGGTMRNVPIGAGRRKNKQFASHYHEAYNGAPSNKIETSNTTNHHHNHVADVPFSEAKGTVLKFGLDNCPSESVESCSELAASTVSYDPTLIHHPLQYHQQIPAVFLPWNGNGASFQWCSSPNVAISGPLNVPLQFVAAPCVPMYTGGGLGVFNGGHCFSSSASINNALGKHSRDPNGGILESSCLLPKVPKIDGQFEASNSLSRTQLAANIGTVGSRSKGECSGSDSKGSLG